MATHFSILVWRIPWTEEPGGLRNVGSQKSQTQLKRLSTHAGTVKYNGGVNIEKTSGLKAISCRFQDLLMYLFDAIASFHAITLTNQCYLVRFSFFHLKLAQQHLHKDHCCRLTNITINKNFIENTVSQGFSCMFSLNIILTLRKQRIQVKSRIIVKSVKLKSEHQVQTLVLLSCFVIVSK